MSNPKTQPPSSTALSRRDFLKTSSLAAGAAALSFPAFVSAQTKPTINAAVIGAGGRGLGAAGDLLNAAKQVGVEAKIVAIADAFKDRSDEGQRAYNVPANQCFTGLDAFAKALAVPDVNYVILAEPPGFRPPHFKAAIEAGKHVFMEKPVAVDGPGCRIMYETYDLANKKGLKVAAGTQRRHQPSYVETVKRIQDGAIGDIVTLRAYWVNGGPIWHRGDNGSTDLERQIRNWYHYIWLSGDHICEQHVHNIDVCNWIMQDHPVRCWGMGARQMLGDKSGEIWDEFAVEYEYANGARMFSYCGQIRRDWQSVSEAVHGTKGHANPGGSINAAGQEGWSYSGANANPYVQEHVDLLNAIINDTELNEAKNVTDSTLTAIMGREAAYSGAGVDWDSALNSKFAYGPEVLYTDAAAMQWGDFRTLKPPMPKTHNILAAEPMVQVASR